MRRWLDRLKTALRDPFALYCPFFFLLPFAGGGYFPWQWGLATGVHGLFLLWQTVAGRRLLLPRDGVTTACLAVIGCGAVWSLYAGIDPGGCWEGLLRLLACALFGLLILQWTASQRRRLLGLVPWIGACMVLLCLAGGLLPSVRPLLYESSRMAGPFQYANTFAAFLLAGLAVDRKGTARPLRLLLDGLLLFGIAASGSRGVLLLAAAWLAYRALRKRDWRLLLVLAVVAAAVGVLVWLQNGWTFARFFRPGSLSTVWGRLLYMKDGARLLAHYPLGVGYLGWFYLQQMIQTGVYNVRFVHNDLLQMALDYGIPAAAAALCWVAHRLRRKSCAPVVAVLLLLHCLMDLDLQFQCMVWLLLLALSPAGDDAPLVTLRGRAAGILAASAAMLLILPRGMADAAYRLDHLDLARALAPWDTELAVEQMLTRTSLDQAAEDAQALLERDPFQPTAWQILAEEALSRGDYQAMADAQRQAVILRKYDQAMYDEALARLQYVMEQGCPAKHAAEEMAWLLDYMDTTLENTDPLGWKLRDQPELELPAQTRLMIRLLDQATG